MAPALGGDMLDISAIISSIDNDVGDAPDKLLLDAVRDGDVHAVRKAINSVGQVSVRPKLFAIERGRADILRCLLEKDNLMDKRLIKAACISKDEASILTLLDFGWSISEPLNPDEHILWAAVNDLDLACFLVDVGADVNRRSRYNTSALSAAITYGSMEVVRFLIAQGADVTHGDLLHCAAVRANQFEGAELVEELAPNGVDVNAHSFDDAKEAPFPKLYTPLHVAVELNNIPVATALLDHGADPRGMCTQASEPVEPTVLQEAVEKNNHHMITLLKGNSRL